MAQSSTVAKAITNKVAEYEECPPEVLPELKEKIDPETYRQLTTVEGPLTEPLEFEYLWYQVTVLPDREIIVTP